MKLRLQSRRSEQRGPGKSPEMLSRPSQISPHVELIADFYCVLFEAPDGTLRACLVDRDHQPDTPFSDYVLDQESAGVAGSCMVFGEKSPKVRVSKTARAGDVVLSFRTNGTEVGVLVRKEQDASLRYLIVGQAVFHEATTPCPGGANCSCGFRKMPHQQKDAKMKVHFDPEDMLLFACQDLYKSLGEDPEGVENLRRFESIHTGEMIQVAALEELRFMTSVVRADQPVSSYVEKIEMIDPRSTTEDEQDMARKLEALQLHLNGLKTGNSD